MIFLRITSWSHLSITAIFLYSIHNTVLHLWVDDKLVLYYTIVGTNIVSIIIIIVCDTIFRSRLSSVYYKNLHLRRSNVVKHRSSRRAGNNLIIINNALSTTDEHISLLGIINHIWRPEYAGHGCSSGERTRKT